VRKDAKQLARRLSREGFDVTIENEHYFVRRDGRLVTTFGTTPGGRNRWRQNAIAQIRKWQRGEQDERAPALRL
jgi:hypothetical protein